jgi:lysophospholipase
VVGAARRTPFPNRFRNNLWTSDRKRFDRNHKRITQQPELSAALVTYGWVAATYDSIDALWKAVRQRPLKTPTLIAVAESERVVSNRAIRKFVTDAGNCRMIKIDNARHEILQEAYRQRGVFWQAFDEFMNR